MAYTYMMIVVNLFECAGSTFKADGGTIASPECTSDLVAGICYCTRRKDPSSSEPVVCRKALEQLDGRIEVVNDGSVCAIYTCGAQRAVGTCVCYQRCTEAGERFLIVPQACSMLIPFMRPEIVIIFFDVLPIRVHIVQEGGLSSSFQDTSDIILLTGRIAA